MVSSSCVSLFFRKAAARSDGCVSELDPSTAGIAVPLGGQGAAAGTAGAGRAVELPPGRQSPAGPGRVWPQPRGRAPSIAAAPRGNSASPTLTNYRASILTI